MVIFTDPKFFLMLFITQRTLRISLFIVMFIATGINYVYAQGEVQNPTGGNPGPFWKTVGNASTNASVNFIGTTDVRDWVIRTNNIERARVASGGNVGIGITVPANRLDVAAAARTGTHGSGLPLYVTGTLGSGSSGVEFRHDNGTQGIGFGFNTIYATGSNANQDLGLNARGTGNLNFFTNATQRMIILGSNGNVGMGTTTPAYRLDLATGTFGFGNANQRTETRDNAGLQGNAGAQSGFYETVSPTNYPAGASSWWHLIDSRHSNTGNNYAMQIAGSFFDQELWFRKTNGAASTAWSRVISNSNLNSYAWSLLGNSGTNAANNFIGTTDAVDWVVRTSNAERMRVTAGGNVGIGIAGATQKLDVQGGNARINNTFLGDVGHGANWGAFSHSSQNNTTGYALLESSDGAYTLINKQNTGGGYIGFRVANADVAVILNNGNMGVGTTAPSTKIQAVADADNLPVIYGINTNLSGGTTSYGVRGECGSVGLGSAGVSGVSTNSGQNEIGTLGDYALWGTGVFGLGWAAAYSDMPTTRDFGVFGTVNFSTGTGVYGRNTNTTVGSAYGMYCMGNFAVTGAKSASVATSKGNQLVYSTESPEIWFEDFGRAELQNGKAVVQLDPLFLETVVIDEQHPMEVFIQEREESKGMIVRTGTTSFEVVERGNGSSCAKFSYRVVAKRKHYQDVRFGVDANQAMEDNRGKVSYQQPPTTDPAVMQQLVNEATAKKNALVNPKKD